MYAVIETGGKQYKVSTGDVIWTEKINGEPGTTVKFDKVLLIHDNDGQTIIGKPYIEGASVSADIIKQGKAPKIVVFKYRHKSNYRRKYGHRQPYTSLKIGAISTGTPSASTEAG
ncbi:MAG TPA: 50S ribosomal protein L21 [Firmicutes bacterium]|nr:50S ribosomal protein L21 [Bacillota bacterium]